MHLDRKGSRVLTGTDQAHAIGENLRWRSSFEHPANAEFDPVFKQEVEATIANGDFFDPVGQQESACPLTMEELTTALAAFKPDTAPGADGISIRLLRLIGDEALQYLLSIFNESWDKGIYPQQWASAVVTPLAKVAAPQVMADYRPISLLNVIGKVMERTVHPRIEWDIEK